MKIGPLRYLYLLLFFLTPLLFTSANSELFELPKMYFVYGLTLLILIFHLINVYKGHFPLFRHTPLDFPLLAFLASQIISTIFSVDVHTSIFGYYSRLNGGLLSLLAYLSLYWVLAVYLSDLFKKQLLSATLISGLFVALFGIAEHFGIDKNIWVQDVQSRVFSTLGQPNWLAAYLCILIPLALYKLQNSESFLSHSGYSFLVSSFYLCLLFTKSKSGIIASIISILVYVFIIFVKKIRTKDFFSQRSFLTTLLILAALSLTITNPIKEIIFPAPVSTPKTSSTLNITPSEDIRKIVWQGSLKLWQQFPLFGTGPETFAYTYYWARPASHNLTSEWDFLYNKAHNEYLNYLATTGSFGAVTYAFLILSVLFILLKSKSHYSLAVLASYISILITNFAGFSVVIISIFFYLLPLFAYELPIPSPAKPTVLKKIFSVFIILILVYLSLKNLNFYLADITYSQSESFDTAQKYSAAYDSILISLRYRPDEPVYLSQAADLAAKMALLTKDEKYIKATLNYLDYSVTISPFNLNMWKERAQTFYYLSYLDKKYYSFAIDSLIKATKLAPTDARSFYMLGQFYQNGQDLPHAIAAYSDAIKLKPNYDYAYFALGKIYLDAKEYPLAQTNFESTLKIAPTNVDAKNYLSFIATQSGVTK